MTAIASPQGLEVPEPVLQKLYIVAEAVLLALRYVFKIFI
jgi:hypothetical protein